MTQDIFADWKNKRFVIADGLYPTEDASVVVLTDFNFWGQEHVADQLTQWCLDNDCHQKGATVEIADKQTLTTFILQWS
jgi:hypothetical protein